MREEVMGHTLSGQVLVDRVARLRLMCIGVRSNCPKDFTMPLAPCQRWVTLVAQLLAITSLLVDNLPHRPGFTLQRKTSVASLVRDRWPLHLLQARQRQRRQHHHLRRLRHLLQAHLHRHQPLHLHRQVVAPAVRLIGRSVVLGLRLVGLAWIAWLRLLMQIVQFQIAWPRRKSCVLLQTPL